jgi:hypothetical protein
VAEIPVRAQCKVTGPTVTPLRFQLDNRDLRVEEILDQWWGEDAIYFKVRADDDKLYILKHKAAGNAWAVDSLVLQKSRAAERGLYSDLSITDTELTGDEPSKE